MGWADVAGRFQLAGGGILNVAQFCTLEALADGPHRKGLIIRLPGHHRYQLTPLGRRVGVLFTKVYGRVLAPGLAELDSRLPTDLVHRSDLARAWRQLDRRLNQFTNAALTAA